MGKERKKETRGKEKARERRRQVQTEQETSGAAQSVAHFHHSATDIRSNGVHFRTGST